MNPSTLSTKAEQLERINAIVHRLLVVGLFLSTASLLFGVALTLLAGTALPTTTLSFSQLGQQLLQLQPGAFLTLGLLILIATPIVRVFGSFLAFAYERDYRYALVTLLVLIIVLFSIFLGKG